MVNLKFEDRIVNWLKQNPGWHDSFEISDGANCKRGQIVYVAKIRKDIHSKSESIGGGIVRTFYCWDDLW